MIIRNLKWLAASLLLLLGLRYFQTPAPVPAPTETRSEQSIPLLADGFPYLLPDAEYGPPYDVASNEVPVKKQTPQKKSPAPTSNGQVATPHTSKPIVSEPIELPKQTEEVYQPTPEQEIARERERSAEEDPLAQQQLHNQEHPEEVAAQADELNAYLSARINHRWIEGNGLWGDTGSRMGIKGRWQFQPKNWLFGGAEAGVNLLSEASLLFQPGSQPPEIGAGDSIFPRLYYLGYESPEVMAVVGKSWSSYYQIASFTDRFATAGGDASGSFNAGTDGGKTGTGRADNVLQLRNLIDFFPAAYIKPFSLNIQLQNNEPIPAVSGARYGINIGISAILQTQKDYTIGFAYNRARIDDKNNPGIINAGIRGDAEALLIGTRWFDDNWYIGGIVSHLKNHETTDQKIYFNGTGMELFGQYQIVNNVWGMLGWNYLKPNSDQPRAGDYLVKFGIVGLRYTLDDFRRMVFIEARIDNSLSAQGVPLRDSVSVGIRWDWP